MCATHDRSSTQEYGSRGAVEAARGTCRTSAQPVRRSVRARAARWFGGCFYACGNEPLPGQISCLDGEYTLDRILKHDFMAATAVYTAADPQAGRPRKLVYKVNRRMHFCLVPLAWLGRLVTHNEVRNLRRCEGIPEVPEVLARLHPNVYVCEYIEGKNLGEKPDLPVDFFENVLAAVRQIHKRNLIHFDLHKPGNLLVGDDGRPHIIDFQISMHFGDRRLLSRRLSARVRRRLQAYDIYHVCKHKRRLQPHLLTEDQDRLSRNHSLPLRIHRAIANPLRRVRRACLRYLHAKGVLTNDETSRASAETNPTRWTRK